ncbi:hypothetical protein AB0I54_37500 [Streptomyces sp. NPDC050625]|uniref:hypothetical protein n=1 Tax=Streptomyces sp. NPDC050625 TaxID=3154629 RepID=UPI003446D7A4
MIKQVLHPVAVSHDPAGIALALQVAYELHAPAAATRPPEVAAPQMMGLRLPAARPHRHKVPLKRLTTMRG